MKQFLEVKEVLDSWRRCMEKGILRTATSPAIYLEIDAQIARIKENVLVPIFEECLWKIRNFITNEYLFLLVDCDGVLLKKTVEIQTK